MNEPTPIFWMQASQRPERLAADDIEAYLASFGLKVILVEWDPYRVARIHEQAPVLVLDLVDLPPDRWCAVTKVSRVPGVSLLVILPRCSAQERAVVLDHGADDCLSQPLERREVAARIQSLLRRRQRVRFSLNELPRWVRFGPWLLDTDRRTLKTHGDVEVSLSMAEYRLLLTFLQTPCQVFTRDRLMDEARGRGLEAFERSIDLLVSRLRHKLGDDPRHPSIIQTVRGQGYLFNAMPAVVGVGTMPH